MNKKEILATLTEGEKALLTNIFDEGFAFDDLEENFMTWGVDGKQERGVLSSLVKKGVVIVENWGRNEDGYIERPVFVADGFTKKELLEAIGYEGF